MAARTAGIDRNEEITPLSPRVLNTILSRKEAWVGHTIKRDVYQLTRVIDERMEGRKAVGRTCNYVI